MYSLSCIGLCRPGSTSLILAPVILGLLLIFSFISPVLANVSADVVIIPASRDPLAQDNPEVIAALKTHVAYVGQTQDARMDGVIIYIDTISDGTGSGSLREIREDYMAVASSIPVMKTADDIAEARAELQRQSRLFAEETKMQIVTFNGSTDAMRQKAASSIQAMENSITNLKDSLWLAKDTARLTVFNRESQNLSRQIDARRTDLQKALTDKSVAALKASNGGLKLLNREFRTTIEGYQTNLQIEMKRAAILAMQ